MLKFDYIIVGSAGVHRSDWIRHPRRNAQEVSSQDLHSSSCSRHWRRLQSVQLYEDGHHWEYSGMSGERSPGSSYRRRDLKFIFQQISNKIRNHSSSRELVAPFTSKIERQDRLLRTRDRLDLAHFYTKNAPDTLQIVGIGSIFCMFLRQVPWRIPFAKEITTPVHYN